MPSKSWVDTVSNHKTTEHGQNNKNLPQGIWVLFTMQVVGGKGWKNPAVIASLLWRTFLMSVWIATSHSAQRNGRGSQPWQRTAAPLMEHCWHICVPTFSFAAALLIKCGLSARHLSKRERFRVLQSEDAWGVVVGVGGTSMSAQATLRECCSSCKKRSV